MGCTASGVWFDSIILLFCRQFQKFLVRLDALGHKFAIPEQCVCCDRCRHILSRLFLGDVDGFERDSMFLCSLLYLWHPIIGVGALVGIVEDKAVFLYYTDQCPYTYYWVPKVQEAAKEHGVPFKAVHITEKETAQNVPAPVTTYALFRDGKFVTQSIQSDKKFLKLAAE